MIGPVVDGALAVDGDARAVIRADDHEIETAGLHADFCGEPRGEIGRADAGHGGLVFPIEVDGGVRARGDDFSLGAFAGEEFCFYWGAELGGFERFGDGGVDGPGDVGDADVCAGDFFDAVEDGDFVLGLHMRASTGAGDSRVGVGAEDDDGFHFRAIEREEIAFVLEENRSFAGDFECDFGALWIVHWNRRVLLLLREEIHRDGDSEYSAAFVIDRRFGDFSFLDERQEIFAVHEFSAGHFESEAAIGASDRIVRGAPVGHFDSGETPFFLSTWFWSQSLAEQ